MTPKEFLILSLSLNNKAKKHMLCITQIIYLSKLRIKLTKNYK